MTKKLEIIGPYTPNHPGPFCTRDGRTVEFLTKEGRGAFPIKGYIGDSSWIDSWDTAGVNQGEPNNESRDLMNAREVRVPREVWVNEYKDGLTTRLHTSKEIAVKTGKEDGNYLRTIHFREVVEGE